MNQDVKILKELKKELKRDKLLAFLKYNLKRIIFFVLGIIAILLAIFAYNTYLQSVSNQNSMALFDAKELIAKSKKDEAIKILDQLIEDGNSGYQFLASLEKANLFFSEAKYEQSIVILTKLEKNNSLPQYYQNMLRTLKLMRVLRSSTDYESNLALIKKSLDNSDNFYYYNLEMYAATLFMLKKYDLSLEAYNKIAKTNLVSKDLRDRANRAIAVLVSYQ